MQTTNSSNGHETRTLTNEKMSAEETKSLTERYEDVVMELQANQDTKSANTNIKDFRAIKVLGTGTYGKVILVRHKKSEKLYAMKVLKKDLIRERN